MTTEPEDTPGGSQELVNGLVGLVDSERRTRKKLAKVPQGMTRQRRAQLGLAVAATILIGFHLVSFGAPLVTSFFEPKPPAAVVRQEAQAMLRALIGEIESFRRDYNELPATLVEVGVPPRGTWTYAVLGETDYALRGTLYGQSVSFDSTSRAGAR